MIDREPPSRKPHTDREVAEPQPAQEPTPPRPIQQPGPVQVPEPAPPTPVQRPAPAEEAREPAPPRPVEPPAPPAHLSEPAPPRPVQPPTPPNPPAPARGPDPPDDAPGSEPSSPILTGDTPLDSSAAEDPTASTAPQVQGIIRKGPTPRIVEVRFKGKRRDFFTAHVLPPIRQREYVVVEADRGQDLGLVTAIEELAKRKCEACDSCAEGSLPTHRILRRAAPVDVERLIDLRRQEADVRVDVRRMVLEHKLKMKISDVEWQWDRNKLIIYFTADKRVDFRVLVRSLAKRFRTRIELKQIGVRDEAKRLDGVGRCGRELCSSNWLPELKPVTLQLAKDQDLSLNPSQISGACGRLMCSLRYEHDFYVQARKRFPKEGRLVRTSAGSETVAAVNIFGNRVTLKGESGEERTLTLEQLKRETAEVRKSSRAN